MGATPLPFNAPLLTLAASNVLTPAFWRPAVLPLETHIRLRNLDPHKRPFRAFIDGTPQGPAVEMTASSSDTGGGGVALRPEYDPVAKRPSRSSGGVNGVASRAP